MRTLKNLLSWIIAIIIALIVFAAAMILSGCENKQPAGAPANVTVTVRTYSARPTNFATMPTLETSVSVAKFAQGRQCITTWYKRECKATFSTGEARIGDELTVKVRETGCLPTVDTVNVTKSRWNCTVAKKSFTLSEGTETETLRKGDETTVITVTASARS